MKRSEKNEGEIAIKILVTGDRLWNQPVIVFGELENITEAARLLYGPQEPIVIIEGGAKGADTIARRWATTYGEGTSAITYKARWKEQGRAAGPIRNRQMLNDNHDVALVVAFHDSIATSKGTRDMIAVANQRGIPVRLVRTHPLIGYGHLALVEHDYKLPLDKPTDTV